MTIFEFSPLVEKLYVYLLLLVLIGVICANLWIIIDKLRGKYRKFAALPLIAFIVLAFGIHGKISRIEALQEKVEQGSLLEVHSRLVSINSERVKGLFRDPHNLTPLFLETIHFDNKTLLRPSPKIYAGNYGCLKGILKSKLEQHVGKQVKIRYLENDFARLKIPSLCIVSVEVL
ncbi:hypothetical protein C2869_22290 (plasmid) [Saccharobesus litoralis]|uniref:Uncharacterized protein n=1 Tax=Saccharobesus litoralis TaxID=2172099 RepID=A0A2S0VYH8_9ALTE|nr:hypothetical protein [Saccharobesus litoralis]AWB69232.1 hypothetical protein C2869_22290 [Saccharobesus litoralis]